MTAFVEGPAGIGKTSLVTYAREAAAASGMTVLHGRGSPLEREFAMGVVRQCFVPELRRRDDDALLDGAARLAAGVVVDVTGVEETAPAGVMHGLYWLTANLAERAPALLAVDDAHWADEASLRFLAYLTARVESLPVAIVVATRPPQDPEIARVLEEVRRGPSTTLIEPAPLDPAGVAELLRAVDAGPVEQAFARACHEASGGNPFLLGELIRALRAERVPFTALHAGRVVEVTPPPVARSVQATLERLGRVAQALARSLAVLGDDVPLDLAAELAGQPVVEATFAAGELTRAGLLADATPLRFRHPLLAGGVRATLPAAERAALHGRAAELLRARGGGAERVAVQLMHATPGRDPGVVDELRAAAARARARGSPATTVALLRRALDEPPPDVARSEILLDLGHAELAIGRTADAAEHLDEAQRTAADPIVRGRAVLALFDARGGDFRRLGELEPLIRRAREETEERDRELSLRLWCVHQVAMGSADVFPGAAEFIAAETERALKLPADTPGEALVLGHMAVPLMYTGATAAEVCDISRRAARQTAALSEAGDAALVITAIYLGLFWSEELTAAEAVLERVLADARRRGSTTEASLAHIYRGWVHRRAGRLREAEADARIAAAMTGEGGWAGAAVAAIIPLVGALSDAGRLEEAEREMTAAFPPGTEIPDHPAAYHVTLERMALRVELGRHQEALDDWEEGVRHAERGPFGGIDCPQWVTGMTRAADAHAALGEHGAALALAERAVRVARHWGTPGFIGEALHARARLQPRDDAIETLREAVAELERSPARLDHARALVTLGAFLRRRGDRVDSREPLRAGYELAVACGAEGLAETARAELRTSGIRVQREQRSGADALTASERRIAEMATAGSSNSEIAQALFLTVKTVEMHLTRAYRKLDVTGRAQLAGALAGEH